MIDLALRFTTESEDSNDIDLKCPDDTDIIELAAKMLTKASARSSSTDCRDDGKNLLDYVTRRFNAPLAGLKTLVGLDLRWDTA